MTASNVFAVPVFLVVFRETLETAIIVSILLAFIKQTLDGPDGDKPIYKTLRRQVWLGTGIGFLICMIVAGAIIGTFYTVGHDAWQAHEYYYEGAFCLFASLVISIMGVALLRIGTLQDKWRVKLAKAMEAPIKIKTGQGWFKHSLEKYAMFILPFVTVLREGIEAIIFVSGVSFSAPATAIPLPVVIGLIAGGVAGYIIYRQVKTGAMAGWGGKSSSIQIFLVVSTCFLYLVAAGLFSRGVWFLETQEWNELIGGDAAELGNGPGSYDIDRSVWHVNCCSPQLNGGGGWGIFNALFGWNNSATYGSVISYNVYWIAVIAGFLVLRFREANGHYPFLKGRFVSQSPSTQSADREPVETVLTEDKAVQK